MRRLEREVFSVFSVRERELLQLLSEGLATKPIAARLGVSVKTVEIYRFLTGYSFFCLSLHAPLSPFHNS